MIVKIKNKNSTLNVTPQQVGSSEKRCRMFVIVRTKINVHTLNGIRDTEIRKRR